MTYKGFEITTVCANNISHDDVSTPVYGDIYDDYNEYLSDHPDDEAIFGFFINYYDAPDWFYSIEDAMKWVDEYTDTSYPLTFEKILRNANVGEYKEVTSYESQDGHLIIHAMNTDYVIVVDEIDVGVTGTYSIHDEVSEDLLPFDWIKV